MAKEICISSTPHETRLAILEDDQLTEIYYERENEYTLAGSIYKGRVTRVLPGMQSAFVDLGLERDAFLYVTDFMEEQEDSADFERVAVPNGTSGRESQPVRESAPRDESRTPRPQAVAVTSEPAGSVIAATPQSADSGQKDEEFEQGTRRWRGRRGRRRGGRPQGLRDGQAAPSAELKSSPSDLPIGLDAPEPNVYEETVSPDLGQAAFSERTSPVAPPPFTAALPSAGSQPIVLPGESLSRYGGKPAASAPRQESRGAAAPAPTATSSFKPATLVEIVHGWDGGAELPGETLSRHRNKTVAASQAAPSGQGAEFEPAHLVSHAWQVPGEDNTRALEAHAEEAEAAFAEGSPAGELSAESIGESSPRAAVEPSSEALHHTGHDAEPPTLLEIASDPEFAGVDAPLEDESVVGEEDASASYRIDPSGPSEYRLSPTVEEELIEEEVTEEERTKYEPAGEEETVVRVDTASAFVRQQEDAPVEEQQAAGEQDAPSSVFDHAAADEPIELQHGVIEPAAEATTPPEELATAYEDEVRVHSHTDTSTEAADPLLEKAMPEVAASATAERAIGEEKPEVAETSQVQEAPEGQAEFAPEAGSPEVIATQFFEEAGDEDSIEEPLGFAPGAGTLEEEILDEEEFESEPIRAFADEHDFDDLEEETLDNLPGAELSELVRDAHLEQRIAAAPEGSLELEESEAEYGQIEIGIEEEEDEEAEEGPSAVASPAPGRAPRSDDGRRGGRGPRRRGRPNGSGGSGSGGPGSSGSRRANSQLSDLPIISELLKQGQEILVQIAKEPIAKKGARITSHIALPGRFLVFMPTVNHVGVSRKISSDEERQRLKRILISEKGSASGGFIVRTAADGASEDDLRADIRFLISLWSDVKQRADAGKAPALIYHDLNLIERVLRDQVSANFSTIWVDNEAEYERIVRFLNRFEPSLVRRVKLYTKETPLFEQFGIQDEISKALKSKVWLKSGGSIVINQTEALVAIDINTGKYVGKTARLEDTIVKTNLDAIPEIVRQIRLRDLGGIIIIDFIDMDDRRNRHKVMAALEEELKSDRAPSKVLQFNDFGLVAITRKRVKQSLERTLSVQCEICAGTGMVKGPTTVCNEIYTELRKMQKHIERGDVLLRVHPEVVKTLKANNAKWLNELEEMTAKTIIVKSDPALHPEQFDIH